MDSFSSPIPIKHVFKISEKELKTKFETENQIISEATEINDIPGIECRICLLKETDKNGEGKQIFNAFLEFLVIKNCMAIATYFHIEIKSAKFFLYGGGFYTTEENSWGEKICAYGDLYDPEKKFIVNGEFVIEMKGIACVTSATVFKPFNTGNCLSENLWKDDDERDFTIVVGNEKKLKTEINIHKCVLSVRSPVFQRMFKNDMKEKREGKVQVIDFNSDTVKYAVAFCYEQDIFKENLKWQQLIDLHQFADKYDIQDLKQRTELFLVPAISFETVCEIMNAAIMLNSQKLQDFCFQFLLISMKEEIPIKNKEILDKNVERKLMAKVSTFEY
uniref:BTB domain-containing protein n=1 Tax=Panagrolaimus davidi TaxID=227884 RepID=A0A914QQW5_9BILA